MGQFHLFYLKEQIIKKYVKSETIKNWEQQFPELANLDRMANHWAKELLTLYPEQCKKNWQKNYSHIEVKIDKWQNKRIILASNHGIISSDNKYPRDTIIFIQNDKSHATMFKWAHRYNQFSWSYIQKIDDKSFLIKTPEKQEIKQYRKFEHKEFIYYADTPNAKKGEAGFYDELYAFKTSSLVGSMVHNNSGYAGSKGAKVSNSNSATQSKRSKGKIREGKAVTLEFDCAYGNKTERKNFVDAYKIVVKYYGKSMRTFRRDLQKGELKINCGDYYIYCSLGLAQTQHKYNIYNIETQENSESINNYIIYGGFVPNPKDNTEKTDPEYLPEPSINIQETKKLYPEYEKWKKWCEELDPEACWTFWTFEEWVNIKKAA